MIVFRILLSLLGAFLLGRGFYESRLTDGAVIETQMYIVLYAVGAILLLTGLMMPLLRKAFKKLLLFRVFAIACCAVLLFLFVTAGIVAAAPLFMPKATGEEAMMIVLGAPVVDDEPSYCLRSRAKKAAEWVNAHPDMYVVISGGKGGIKTEAETIAGLMVQDGANEEMLLLENRATTTDENFGYAKELLSELADITSMPVIVLTNHFHLFRLHYYAERQGFCDVRYITAPTPPEVRLLWYARETVLTIRFWFTGK